MFDDANYDEQCGPPNPHKKRKTESASVMAESLLAVLDREKAYGTKSSKEK